MTTRRHLTHLALASLSLATAALMGCASMNAPSNMVAMSTALRGANEVPANASTATGTVDAVLNKDTNLLRWKINYTGLTGPATAGHFHGPAAITANAGVVLGWATAENGSEGSATLTAAQAADLVAGRWYANIHTKAHPGGEIRGQMTVRN
ncbi:MAG: CHRD domain-containing protein [Polaromonas sp.]